MGWSKEGGLLRNLKSRSASGTAGFQDVESPIRTRPSRPCSAGAPRRASGFWGLIPLSSSSTKKAQTFSSSISSQVPDSH